MVSAPNSPSPGGIQSENHFRSLIDNAPVATCLFVGPDMKVEIANDLMLGYWGKDRSILGMPLKAAVPELVNQPFLDILDEVYRTGKTHHAEAAAANLPTGGKAGTYYFNFTYKPLLDENGKVYAIMDMAVDVTQEVKAKALLNEVRQRSALAIELAEVGVFEVNTQTDESIGDERFYQIFGVQPGTPRSQYLALVDPRDLPVRQRAYEELSRSGNLDYRARLNLPDQSIKWIRVKARSIRTDDGQPSKLIGLVQDITIQKAFEESLEQEVHERTVAMKNLEYELLRKIEELQRTNRNLEEFAYAASHDLKEPIRKLLFFADLLHKSLQVRLTEREEHHFSRMEAAGKRMFTLVEDLLSYSQINQRFTLAPVDLNEIVSLVLGDLELEIAQKRAVVKVKTLFTMQAHARSLQQVFQNLIGNALKYSSADHPPVITIVSSVVAGKDIPVALPFREQQLSYYVVAVSDNGIGFQQADATRIFDVFTRLHGNEAVKGTGVGLAIVRKVMENHHGFVRAESEIGEGSCFYLTLRDPADRSSLY